MYWPRLPCVFDILSVLDWPLGITSCEVSWISLSVCNTNFGKQCWTYISKLSGAPIRVFDSPVIETWMGASPWWQVAFQIKTPFSIRPIDEVRCGVTSFSYFSGSFSSWPSSMCTSWASFSKCMSGGHVRGRVIRRLTESPVSSWANSVYSSCVLRHSPCVLKIPR